jgi:hypothetical protein
LYQAYLEHLTSTDQWQLAAGQLARLLRGSAEKWEHWVAAFAAADQVSLLAALVPIESPQLSPASYEAILNGLLKDPANHGRVLLLVQSWPRALYSAPQLIDNIAQVRSCAGAGAAVDDNLGLGLCTLLCVLWCMLAVCLRGSGGGQPCMRTTSVALMRCTICYMHQLCCCLRRVALSIKTPLRAPLTTYPCAPTSNTILMHNGVMC